MAELAEAERLAMGRRAAEVVADWGPDRFAAGRSRPSRLADADRGRDPETLRH